MKLHILHANDKTSLGIAFGVTQVKVKVTLAKMEKWFLFNNLSLEYDMVIKLDI